MKDSAVEEANLRVSMDDIDPLDYSSESEDEKMKDDDSDYAQSEAEDDSRSDDDTEKERPRKRRKQTHVPEGASSSTEEAEEDGDEDASSKDLVDAADSLITAHTERTSDSLAAQLRDLVKTETIFRCGAADCGKSFKRKVDLERHLLIHLGMKNFACEECDARFTRKGDLVRHKRSHAKDASQRFVCDVPGCGKSYTLHNNLSRHKKTCHEQKRYPCSLCDKAFTQTGDLKRHMAVHTGARPFACEQCGAGFKQKAHLNQHMRSHK